MLSSWPINISSFSLTEALLLTDVIRSQVQKRRRKTGPMELQQDEKFVFLSGRRPVRSKRTAKALF
jgi:hypothetical protein